MKIDSKATAVTALGFVAALMFSTPTALADPALADPVPADPMAEVPAPAPALAVPAPAPAPAVAPAAVPPSCRRLHLPWRRLTRRFPHLRPR